MMAKMRAVQVGKPKGPFEIVEREIPPLFLISGRRSVMGWPSGSAKDSQDTLAFSALTGVRPMIEAFPLEKVNEAYEKMMSGNARFRVVLTF